MRRRVSRCGEGIRRGLLILLWSGGLLAAMPASRAAQEAALEAGRPVERAMAGGESHVYSVALAEGQHLAVSAEQRGIDFNLRLFGPDGQLRLDMDSLNSTQGVEAAAILGAPAGAYRIELLSTNKAAPPGRYLLTIRLAPAPGDAERRRLDAQGAYLDGMRLRARQTEEGRQLAIPRLEEAARLWRGLGDSVMAAHALYAISSCYRLLNRRGLALGPLQEALELLRAAGERREEAPTLTSLGIVFTELGDSRNALDALSRSRDRWRELADPYGEARTLTNLGVVQTSLGEAEKALESYQAALAVWRQFGNRAQEADALAGMGQAHDLRGEWQTALERYEQALALHRALGNRGGEASVLNNVGVLHGRLGAPQKELEFYRRALDLWRALSHRLDEAVTLSNIGAVYAALNDAPAALQHFSQALAIWRQEGNLRGEAIGLQYLGELAVAAGEPRKALGSFEQALPLLRRTGNSWREAGVLRNLAAVHLSIGDAARAQEVAAQALSLFESIGDRNGQALSLFELARAERGLGRLEVARRRIEEAIQRGEAVRAEVDSRQLRTSYLASFQKFYGMQIDLLMQLHRERPTEGLAALALQVSERARARGLLEALGEAGARIRAGADPALLDRERQLAQRINAKALTLMQLTSGPHRAEAADALKRELSQLETEHENAQAEIRRASPRYAAIAQPRSLTLAELQRQLDSETALLEYSLGEERSYAWIVTADSIASYALPAQGQIDDAARQVYDLLIARAQRRRGETMPQQRERIARADTQLAGAVSQLSRLIVAPVAAGLGKRRVLLVADGALQYVPFGMLPAPGAQGERLILRHEIVTLPSATTLALQRQELAGRAPAPRQIAVIADPVFGSRDERTRGESRPAAARSIEHEEESGVVVGRFTIPRLPYTRQEADRILALAPGDGNLKLLDFGASRARVTDGRLAEYRYLHFATHGLLDSEQPGLSALVLSLVDEKGNAQDGFLRAHEIYNLQLPADLVVLSACQTGLGKEIRGEGLVGLTRGFLYAGAARVVVSLWSVNDRATAELMTRFYRKMLREGAAPAAALRAAQIEMLRQPQWSAPYFWAPFVLQGEWR